MTRQYLDPALKGFYPEELAEIFGEAWPAWPAEDLKDICQPVDFIGINYYTRNIVKADPHQWPVGASPVRQVATHTTTDWEVYPPALTDMLVWFRDTYSDIPVYIKIGRAHVELQSL